MYESHAAWDELEHAYGPASTIPVVFDRIAAGKPKDVEKLANWIAHQGWLSPDVALACVEPLVDLTGQARGATRAALLRLLADLACLGDHTHFLGAGLTDDHPVAGLLADPSQHAVRQAVVEATPGLAVHLGDRSAPVRGSAALLFAATGTGADALLARLRKEKNTQARFDLLVALGWVADGALPPPLVADRGHDAEVVRAGAFLGSTYAGGFDDEVAEGLLGAMELEPLKGSAWSAGDLPGHVVDALRHAAQRHARPELMVAAFERVDHLTRSKLGGSLVKTVFAAEIEARGSGSQRLTAPPAPEPPALSSLHPDQRALLELLSRFDSGWGHNCDQRFWLHKLGFPQFPPALKAYLGHPPPPPDALDIPFSWRGSTRTLRDLAGEVCTEHNSVELADVAAATGMHTDQLFEAAGLVCRPEHVPVPSVWAALELATRLLVQAGPSMVPVLTERVAHYQEHGAPSYWSPDGRRMRSDRFGVACVGALHALDETVVVRAVEYPRLDIRWTEEQLDPVGSEVRGWLREGIARNGRR